MPGYYKRKLDTLQAYWDHYQQNHEKLVPVYDEIQSYIAEKSAKLFVSAQFAIAGSSKQVGGELHSE